VDSVSACIAPIEAVESQRNPQASVVAPAGNPFCRAASDLRFSLVRHQHELSKALLCTYVSCGANEREVAALAVH
jgi:hypothetical protein